MAGQLTPGFLGDVVVIDPVDGDPYRNLIVATETHVQLVVIRGEPLYGDEPTMGSVKTYRESVDGATKLVRRYEVLPGALSGPRPKAVDFKARNVPNGDVSANDTIQALTQAMRFDVNDLAQKITEAQITADLQKCKQAPPAHPPTREDIRRFLKCAFPSRELHAVAIDPPFTTTDDEFFQRLEANQNLPPELKRLRNYYRSP